MNQHHAKSAIDTLAQLIAEAPGNEADYCPIPETKPVPRLVLPTTNLPARYRDAWDRPNDADWTGKLDKAISQCSSGGITAMIGPRGCGKTRLAAEVMRDYAPTKGEYVTAMGLFIRIRSSFKGKGETEAKIVDEMAGSNLLVIDEMQERGNTDWEDRLINHILDKRYGAMRPTILIANLTEDNLSESLGASIVSRFMETGRLIEFTNQSHRQNDH